MSNTHTNADVNLHLSEEKIAPLIHLRNVDVILN